MMNRSIRISIAAPIQANYVLMLFQFLKCKYVFIFLGARLDTALELKLLEIKCWR